MTRRSSSSGDDVTLPKLLVDLSQRFGHQRVALQEKRYGIWQPLTWAQNEERVRDFAHGLASLEVKPGEVVAVLGDNRPEWLIAELATQSIGACAVGIYPSSVGDEIVHILNHARVRVVVAEDQEQVDKVLDLWEQLETVERIIFYDPRGLENYRRQTLLGFTKVEQLGREFASEHPGWLDEQISMGKSSDIAVICTTSGTTGKPKLAMLSHGSLLSMARSLLGVDPIGADDRFVSFLPLAWIGEQMIAVACGLLAAFTISFGEEASTTKTDLREIAPDVMFSPPRIWEDMLSSVQVRVGDADPIKRAVFSWGYRLGLRMAGLKVKGERPSLRLRLVHRVADAFALRPVRSQLGLSRIRHAYTGGAPLGPEVFRFFHAIGVNLKQIYGQTEICGIAVLHRDGDIRFNTVGTPIPGTDLEIADNGEILLRSPAVFQGYYRDSKSTRTALDAEGWLHTGDAGYLEDDGHLVVIDRAKDVIQMPDGTRFSPAFVENKLKFSPYIEEAVIFGATGKRNYIAAMITIDPRTTGTWAEKNRISYTTYTDLAQKTEVYELIAREVARANEDLPESVRVRKFVLLHKQLDADDDEITRTRKVRRGVVGRRYSEIVRALYSGNGSVTITGRVQYQDGTSVERQIPLRVMSMEGYEASQVDAVGMAWSVGR